MHSYPNYLPFFFLWGVWGGNTELLIFFSYFCPVLFHSCIYYPHLSSVSSTSLPSCISLKRFLFPSTLVSVAFSLLLSQLCFPSRFQLFFCPFSFHFYFDAAESQIFLTGSSNYLGILCSQETHLSMKPLTQS